MEQEIGFELSPLDIESRKRNEAKEKGLIALREIRNLNELHNLLQELEKSDLHLYSKRKGHWAFDFRQATNPNKTEYLYDDGISGGKSCFKNLHRHLTIR